MPGNYYFVIVGKNDNPIFEMNFSNSKNPREDSCMHEFVAHSALDLIDVQKWKTHNMYLKYVDAFNDWFVSAFVTASLMRFVMVHDIKNEDGIRHFFQEMYEIYIKYSMNPFYESGRAIRSLSFEKKTQFCAKKYLSG